ncbi:hypothetical protein DTO271D3_6787 [Paecilomyces variotii]|nr:hypothetical protein DTO169C6_1749 [Paecilomyces variotii]KAJ9246294.1 hypothetical protein DTO207G8_9097 [Paecilomyces variotii]KAJ9249789.1 hypothetical protein DTO195F2_8393 [Paecilomyces variotii]KAJ9312873.1 hypothetical protein DTO271D3_6787 [Paecilomyces variotii]KAJ9397119.1 hypothetical protein DTO282F9_6052 [Paecilomyces variotii]
MGQEERVSGEIAPKEEPPKVPETEEANELTAQAKIALAGAFGSMFCTVGFVNAFGVFETYYAENQLAHQKETDIAWIGAINVFCIFAGSVFTGPLLDVSGPELMLWLGSLGVVFSIMMASLCKELYQFILAQGILLGISMAFIVTPMIAIISKHFQKKRAAAVGMVIAGSSLGGVIWPVVVHELLEKSNVGFGWTMRIVGFIMLPILGISSLSGRQPAPKTPPAPSSASSAGSDPEPVAKEDQPPAKPKLDFSVVKKPELQLSCAGFFIVYFGMFSPFFYTTAYAVDKGFSSNLSFYTISIINGASLFGRIIPGIVADKYGKFNLCILATMLSGIIAFCWTKVTSVAGLVIFSAAYGFCSGAILSLQQACAAQIATPTTVGTVIGIVMGSCSLSSMAGTVISGELGQKYGFLALSVYSGASLILGGAILLAAKFAQNGKLAAIV